MITYCRNCGANLEPGATKCRRCGAELSEMMEEDPSFTQELKEGIKRIPGGRNTLLILAAILVLLIALGIASALNSRSKAAPPPQESSIPVPVSPSPSPLPDNSPEPSPEPGVNWADIYRNFLETKPSVNSAVVQNASDCGFEGIVTAECFALADINGDDVPELLLATIPDSLPGWNIISEQGSAVEGYIVCGLKEGRISPLMCVKGDYSFYPLTISVNDSWILELSQGSSARRSMLFRSPQSQSSSLSLQYDFVVEQRCNSRGEIFESPAEYYSINGSSATGAEFMDLLFPEGGDTLSYFPIYFQVLSPGCLDELESDWENREVHQLNREDFSRLWSISGPGRISREAEDILPYISDPYCISVTNEELSSAMVIGIDPGLGWEYVQSVEVSSVSVEGADAWLNSAVSQDLPEGQIFEYAVGLSFTAEPNWNYTVSTQLKLKLYDGSEIDRTYYVQAPETAQPPAAEAAAEAAPAV